jgi:hypothetical protein
MAEDYTLRLKCLYAKILLVRDNPITEATRSGYPPLFRLIGAWSKDDGKK